MNSQKYFEFFDANILVIRVEYLEYLKDQFQPEYNREVSTSVGVQWLGQSWIQLCCARRRLASDD
jgi:hypothetical protein